MTKHNKAESEEKKIGEALETSDVFLTKNKKSIIIAIIAVIVIIGGYFFYENAIAKPKEIKAQEAISLGERYFMNGQYDLALNGDSIYFDGFVKVANEYSGTKAANLSNYYIGVSYAKLGQYQDAVKYLEKFSSKDEMIYPASLVALGNCYANLDKTDKAISTLKKAANIADNTSISPIALRQAGILLENQKKFKEAVEVYTEIKNKYFNSGIANDIDKYIERAKAQI